MQTALAIVVFPKVRSDIRELKELDGKRLVETAVAYLPKKIGRPYEICISQKLYVTLNVLSLNHHKP